MFFNKSIFKKLPKLTNFVYNANHFINSMLDIGYPYLATIILTTIYVDMVDLTTYPYVMVGIIFGSILLSFLLTKCKQEYIFSFYILVYILLTNFHPTTLLVIILYFISCFYKNNKLPYFFQKIGICLLHILTSPVKPAFWIVGFIFACFLIFFYDSPIVEADTLPNYPFHYFIKEVQTVLQTRFEHRLDFSNPTTLQVISYAAAGSVLGIGGYYAYKWYNHTVVDTFGDVIGRRTLLHNTELFSMVRIPRNTILFVKQRECIYTELNKTLGRLYDKVYDIIPPVGEKEAMFLPKGLFTGQLGYNFPADSLISNIKKQTQILYNNKVHELTKIYETTTKVQDLLEKRTFIPVYHQSGFKLPPGYKLDYKPGSLSKIGMIPIEESGPTEEVLNNLYKTLQISDASYLVYAGRILDELKECPYVDEQAYKEVHRWFVRNGSVSQRFFESIKPHPLIFQHENFAKKKNLISRKEWQEYLAECTPAGNIEEMQHITTMNYRPDPDMLVHSKIDVKLTPQEQALTVNENNIITAPNGLKYTAHAPFLDNSAYRPIHPTFFPPETNPAYYLDKKLKESYPIAINQEPSDIENLQEVLNQASRL